MEPSPDPVAELLDNYHELNSSDIQELDAEPSPLEFMRYVARNTPFVVRKGAANWTATQTWTASYLRNCLQDQTVNVAVTPKGWVDASRAFLSGHIESSTLYMAAYYLPLSELSLIFCFFYHQQCRCSYIYPEWRAHFCKALGRGPTLSRILGLREASRDRPLVSSRLRDQICPNSSVRANVLLSPP